MIKQKRKTRRLLFFFCSISRASITGRRQYSNLFHFSKNPFRDHYVLIAGRHLTRLQPRNLVRRHGNNVVYLSTEENKRLLPETFSTESRRIIHIQARDLLFQLTSETPLLLSSKKRATRLLFALSSSLLWPVVTISKWNNEKKGRCGVSGDVSSACLRIPKCVLASIFEELAAVVATKWRRDGRTGAGWSEKEASVNRYRFTRALHA